ncbi:hypothetical protein T4D_6953 [Trichinella pseudospiralis]|uniref:Non-homologous end-joining factor 1 n=1 Tax=Trichinella pseudospiralis TaxID=6337 RepID=A0A0V1F5Y9_TRIPS|nr:hypothetical protein T4D_6953 [Trichinella pseudospiralis]
MNSFALWTLVNYLDDNFAWFVRVVVDDDRTVRFDLTNQIQMWRETLNQDEFHRKLTALNCNVEGEIGPLFDHIFSMVLGKEAHCIVKLENSSNNDIVVRFDSKFFRLPLKWKLQAALVAPEIYFQEFVLPFMAVAMHSVDREQMLISLIQSRDKMFEECLEGEGDCSGIQRNWSKFDQHQWCSQFSSIENITALYKKTGNRGEHILQCEQISDRICVIGSAFDLLRKKTIEEKLNLVISASISEEKNTEEEEEEEEEEKEKDLTKSLLSSESDDDENLLSEVSKIPKKILRL